MTSTWILGKKVKIDLNDMLDYLDWERELKEDREGNSGRTLKLMIARYYPDHDSKLVSLF